MHPISRKTWPHSYWLLWADFCSDFGHSLNHVCILSWRMLGCMNQNCVKERAKNWTVPATDNSDILNQNSSIIQVSWWKLQISLRQRQYKRLEINIVILYYVMYPSVQFWNYPELKLLCLGFTCVKIHKQKKTSFSVDRADVLCVYPDLDTGN